MFLWAEAHGCTEDTWYRTWVRFPSSQLWHSKSLTGSAVTLPVAPCTRGLLPIKQKGFINLATKHTLQVYTHIFTFSQGIKKKIYQKKSTKISIYYYTLCFQSGIFLERNKIKLLLFCLSYSQIPFLLKTQEAYLLLVENKCVYLTKTDTRNAIQNTNQQRESKFSPYA